MQRFFYIFHQCLLSQRCWIALFGVVLTFFGIISQSVAQERPYTWVPQGVVSSLAATNNTLYIGGDFSELILKNHPFYGSKGSFLNIQSATADPSFPTIFPDGNELCEVRTAVPDGFGGWFLGGSLGIIGGKRRQGIAQITANGSVTNWQLPFTVSVQIIAVSDSVVCFVGRNSSLRNSPLQLFAVDAASGQRMLWSREMPNNIDIAALVARNNVLFVAGNFTELFGQERKSIAALNLQTGALLSWNPYQSNDLRRFIFTSLVLGDTTVYAIGRGSVFAGNVVSVIGEFSLANATHTLWQPAFLDNTIISAQNTRFGLTVLSRDNVGATFLTAFNRQTGAVNQRSRIPLARASTMVLRDSTVFIAGDFTEVGGERRTRLAAFEFPSGKLLEWSPFVDWGVTCLSISGNALFVNAMAGLPYIRREHLAAINASTGEVLSWNPQVQYERILGNNAVKALHITSSGLYVGGSFTSISDKPVRQLARFRLENGFAREQIDTNFRHTILNHLTSLNINCMTSHNNRLFVGGDGFVAQIDALSGEQIFSVDTILGTPRRYPWLIETEYVHSLGLNNGTLYMGGAFRNVSIKKNLQVLTAQRTSLAAIDISSLSISNWNPTLLGQTRNFDGSVNLYGAFVGQIAIQSNNIYVAGNFSISELRLSRTQNLTLAIDKQTGKFLPWFPLDTTRRDTPSFHLGDSIPSYTGGTALVAHKGVIYTGQNLIAFDTAVGAKELWRASNISSINSLLVHNNTLYAGAIYAFPLASRQISTSTITENEKLPILQWLISPQPAHDSFTLTFSLPASAHVRCTLHTVLGQEIAVLADNAYASGQHDISANVPNVASGLYICRVAVNGRVVGGKSLVITR